jgi:hypothetical protein
MGTDYQTKEQPESRFRRAVKEFRLFSEAGNAYDPNTTLENYQPTKSGLVMNLLKGAATLPLVARGDVEGIQSLHGDREREFKNFWEGYQKRSAGMTDAIEKMNKMNQETFTNSTKIRDEFINRPEVKDYVEVKSQLGAMDKAYNSWKSGNQKSANSVDQVLINTFGRMTDPGATVREAEYARTPEGMALMNRFDAAWSKLSAGGILNDVERESLVKAAKLVADARGNTFNDTLQSYEDLSEMYGLDKKLVIRGMKKHESPFNVKKEVTVKVGGKEQSFDTLEEAEKAKLPKGRKIYIGGRPAITE